MEQLRSCLILPEGLLLGVKPSALALRKVFEVHRSQSRASRFQMSRQPLRDRRQFFRLFRRGGVITFGEVSMHPGACRVIMDLNEHLPDDFSFQSFTNLGELPGGLAGTGLAGKAGGETEARIGIF